MSQEKQSPIEKLPETIATPRSFFTDSPYYREKIPHELKNSSQFAVLSHRGKLREFCLSQKIETPEFVLSEEFARISAWAVKRNKFPLTMKTAQNLSDSEAMYLLKAFRELPDFFDTVQAVFPGAVLLEEFIQTKARIEVTVIDGMIRLVSQVGLEKSMQMRQSWRTFPLKLPEKIYRQINSILSRFADLLAVRGIPLRFSFALNEKPLLLSLNSGMNRPEYNPQWLAAANLPDIFTEAPPPNAKVCKLLNFYGFSNDDFNQQELQKSCSATLAKWASVDNQVIVLLSSDNASTLLEDAKKVDALFKHIRKPDPETILPNEEN